MLEHSNNVLFPITFTFKYSSNISYVFSRLLIPLHRSDILLKPELIASLCKLFISRGSISNPTPCEVARKSRKSVCQFSDIEINNSCENRTESTHVSSPLNLFSQTESFRKLAHPGHLCPYSE